MTDTEGRKPDPIQDSNPNVTVAPVVGAQDPPQNWKETRNRWELFQGIRSWLLLLGFVLLCLAVAARD